MLLSEIVAACVEEEGRPITLLLDAPSVMRCLRKAVRFYCGYAKLTAPALAADEIHDPISASNGADATGQDFNINPSELAIIRPLFDLYVEHENATMLEASRGMGTDVFGRTVTEIQQDINVTEAELPKKAFMEPVETI